MNRAKICLSAALSLCLACASKAPAPASPTTTPAAPAAATPPIQPVGPVHQRAASLREAADLLDKASTALDAGNRDLADLLFSSAEIITGGPALASVATMFRAGGPPVINTPTVKVADIAPQPAAVGNSDDEDEAGKASPVPATRGTLAGDISIDGKSAAGSMALVTLEPIGRKGKSRSPKHSVMEQRDRQFAPRLLVVAVGSTVTFPNFDKVFHNVFSTSEVQPFDLGLYKEGEAREVTFTKEGIVRIGCNLHANMSGTVAVVAAPHYVIADANGHYACRNLEPGKYRMKVWSERSTTPITQEVTVKAGGNQMAAAVKGDAPAGPMPDKFGAPRGTR